MARTQNTPDTPAASGNTGGMPGAQARPVDGIDPETLAKAQAMIAAMHTDYLIWAQEDLTALFTALEAFDRSDSDSAAAKTAAKAEVFRIAHDMKGQGGSFGYPLITSVGNALCRFLEKTADPLSADQIAAIRSHAESLRTILDDRLQGDGGEAGKAMLARLERQRDAALS